MENEMKNWVALAGGVILLITFWGKCQSVPLKEEESDLSSLEDDFKDLRDEHVQNDRNT